MGTPRHSVRPNGRRFGCGHVASENVDVLHATAVVGKCDHREILARRKAGVLAFDVSEPVDLITKRLPEPVVRQAEIVAHVQTHVSRHGRMSAKRVFPGLPVSGINGKGVTSFLKPSVRNVESASECGVASGFVQGRVENLRYRIEAIYIAV